MQDIPYFQKKEQIILPEEYKKYKCCFVVASFNNEHNVKYNIGSIINQDYDNWRIIYVNDASTDKTEAILFDIIDEYNIQDKITYIKNETNMHQAYSKYQAYQILENDEICIILDGDDWLSSSNVLSIIVNTYNTHDCLMTYSKMLSIINNTSQIDYYGLYPYQVKYAGDYRASKKWYFSHLRTGLSKLFKNIPKDYLIMEGEWLDRATDIAELLCIAEMAQERVYFINEVLCVYNYNNSKKYKSSYNNDKNSNKRKTILNYIYNCKKLNPYTINYVNLPAYIIHLSHDIHKENNFIEQMKFANLSYTVIDACDGYKEMDINTRYLKYQSDYKNGNIPQTRSGVKKMHINNKGAMGIIYSTIKCFEMIDKEENIDHVIICEDDIYSHNEIQKYLRFTEQDLYGKDFIMLGFNSLNKDLTDKIDIQLNNQKFTNIINCDINLYGAYAYICSRKFRQYILKLGADGIINSNCSIDLFYNILRKYAGNLNFFIFNKHLFIPEVRKNGIQNYRNDSFYSERNININDYYNASIQKVPSVTNPIIKSASKFNMFY